MKLLLNCDEWYPVWSLTESDPDDVRVDDVPDDLAIRYRMAYAAFVAVREEFDTWLDTL